MTTVHSQIHDTLKRINDKRSQLSIEKARKFKPGDQVLVDRRNLTIKAGNNRSLTTKWIGPYKVLRKIGNHAYELDIPCGIRLHKVIHTTLLKPFHMRSEPQTVENNDEDITYGVEEIIDSVRRKGKVLYRIRWQGYSPDDDTWQTLDTMSCRDEVQAFHEKFPRKPRDTRF